MSTSNHTVRPAYSRVYHIASAGSRLALYLNYVDSHPELSPDLMFADVSVPPEQYDDDRQPRRDHRQEQLDRLYAELEEATTELHRPNQSDTRFEENRQRVQEIRDAIYEIEGA